MSSFNARLRLPGQSKLPLGVEVDISHERMTLTAGDRTVAAWSLEELDVSSLSDGFHIKIDDDEIILNVAESKRFAAELGIAKRPTNGKIMSLPPIAGATLDGEPLDDVQRRISDIAKALTSDSMSPAMAFAQWLSLLKEINLQHGQGSMPTDLYYRLNTQLLGLIPEPAPLPA